MNLTTSPFKRLREATGMSKATFYRTANLSESALTFIEAGLYPTNPAWVEQELLRLCLLRGVPVPEILEQEYGAGTLPAATVHWQKAVRAAMADRVLDGYTAARQYPDEDLSPAEDFARRVSGSKTAFCKDMKIPVAVFYQFDEGTAYSMPRSIWAALSDAKLPERYINELETEQEDWLLKYRQPSPALVD